jgi:hypothetical protein
MRQTLGLYGGREHGEPRGVTSYERNPTHRCASNSARSCTARATQAARQAASLASAPPPR